MTNDFGYKKHILLRYNQGSSVLAVSFLVGFLVALGQNLDLLEQGCPDELLIANFIFTMIAFSYGLFTKEFLDALVRTIGA